MLTFMRASELVRIPASRRGKPVSWQTQLDAMPGCKSQGFYTCGHRSNRLLRSCHCAAREVLTNSLATREVLWELRSEGALDSHSERRFAARDGMVERIAFHGLATGLADEPHQF